MRPKGILFDFDETQFSLAIDWNKLREKLMLMFLRNGFENKFIKLNPSLLAGYSYMKQHMPSKSYVIFKTQVEESISAFELDGYRNGVILDNSIDILAYFLNRSINVGIVSSNSNKILRLFLKDNSLETIAVVGREDVRKQKPSPEGTYMVLSTLGLGKQDTWGVGNSKHDYNAYRLANLNKIFLVNNKSFSPRHTNTKLLSSLSELKNECP